MAKIFLDTNYFIDALHRRPEKNILSSLEGNIVYISPLAVHIYCYIFRIKTPDARVTSQVEKFILADMTNVVVTRALQGPTEDFEDNVQLHSASEATCDIFFTEDKRLLSLRFFGKLQILPQ